MIVNTNYVTQQQFKNAIKKFAEEGKTVYGLLGYLIAAFDLSFDKETDELVTKLIENDHK